MVHWLLAHGAQLHHNGELAFAGVLALVWAVAAFRLADTARRRSRRDLLAAWVSLAGIALVACGYGYDATVPLRPHHVIGLVPTRGGGAFLLIGGMVVCLVGVLLTPIGAAGRWLPADSGHGPRVPEEGVWPPSPKV